MAKNGSAAKAQDGGKAKETTVPGNGSAAPDNALDAGNSAPSSLMGTTGPEIGSASTSTDSQSVDSTLAAGSQVLNSGSETSGQKDSESTLQFNVKSDTDAAAGTGESFAKMLADSSQSTHGLKVISSQAGFRRAGRAWSTTPIVIALSDLTEDEIRTLKAEPMLSLQLVDLDDAEEA